jgi:hypothetical protein
MGNRKMILLVLSVLLIAAFFSIPFYNNWFVSKFGNDIEIVSEQMQHMKTDERMLTRFGNTLLFLNVVKSSLEKYAKGNAMVLLPPKPYVAAAKLKEGNVDMPEPAVFYYFTGFRGLTPSSKDVDRANWVILARDHQLVMYHINSKRMLDSILTTFKPYQRL